MQIVVDKFIKLVVSERNALRINGIADSFFCCFYILGFFSELLG